MKSCPSDRGASLLIRRVPSFEATVWPPAMLRACRAAVFSGHSGLTVEENEVRDEPTTAVPPVVYQGTAPDLFWRECEARLSLSSFNQHLLTVTMGQALRKAKICVQDAAHEK